MQQTVPLSFNWTFWYRADDYAGAKNTDWRTNARKLFDDVSTAERFLKVYGDVKLPSALPPGTSYYFFKRGIRPAWEEAPNRGAGAWKILIGDQMNNDLNLVWSDLLFMLISDGFGELSGYLCGVTCNTRRGGARHNTVAVWTVKTTPGNYRHIMKIGKILEIVVQNIYGLKCLKYKPHSNSPDGFDYAL